MKTRSSGLICLLVTPLLLIIFTSSQPADSKIVLEGDMLVSLIGKHKSYPEIKEILKSREYKFSNKDVSNIYSSEKGGLYLQFNDEGLLICIVLLNRSYMTSFSGQLPGGSSFYNLLNKDMYEWRPNVRGTPLIGHYKDIRLKVCFGMNGDISEVHIEMPNNITIQRAPGTTVNDIHEKRYVSDTYTFDFFCSIINKPVSSPEVNGLLTDKNLNFSNKYDIKTYNSAEYGIRVYVENNAVKSVNLSNNYEHGLLYKGSLPHNTSFETIRRSNMFTWLPIDKSLHARYRECRLIATLFEKKDMIAYLEIDGETSSLDKYYEQDSMFPDGDEWLDYMARSRYDPKVVKLLNCKTFGFTRDDFAGKWASEYRGVMIYETASGYIESILLLNDFEKKPPYQGSLPGNLTFDNILSNSIIAFKPAGKSYVAEYNNYKLRLYSKDGKRIEYLAIDFLNRDAMTKKYDGTWSNYRVYKQDSDNQTSIVTQSAAPLHAITDTCIKQYQKLGYTFVKKHSIRQVGGGGYYTTKCEWSMSPGSNYQIVFIYNNEGVSKLDKQLKNNLGQEITLKTAASDKMGIYKVEGSIAKTDQLCNVKLEATLFFSDEYKSNRSYTDMDILVFRKSE